MFARGFAICLMFGVVSSVQGAVNIILQPTTPGPYSPGQVVTVDVFLQQVPGGTDHLLRYVQLDFTDTSPELTVLLPTMHNKGTATEADDIKFWSFNGTANCPTAGNATCGAGHYIDQNLSGVGGPDTRPNLINMAYYGNLGTSNLGPDSNLQVNLPAGTPVLIGRMDVGLPVAPGTFNLDVINDDETDRDEGAEVRYGFGLVPPADPITGVRGNGTTIPLTGGAIQLSTVVGCQIDFVSEVYPCDATWPRFQKNTIRLTFDAPITLPPVGAIEIRELLTGTNNFGATNFASSFLMTVEGGNTLKLVENGNILTSGKWYAVMYRGTNWTNVCNFERDHAKVAGDADNTTINDFADLSFIFGNQSGAAGDTNRSDVNGDNFVDFADISDAFGFNGAFAGTKPTGHGCTPVP